MGSSGRWRRLAGLTRIELCCYWRFVTESVELVPCSGWTLDSTPGSGSVPLWSPAWPRWAWLCPVSPSLSPPSCSTWWGRGRGTTPWWGTTTGTSSWWPTLTATWRPGRETGRSQSVPLRLTQPLSRQWRKNRNPEDLLKCRHRNTPALGSGVDLNRWQLYLIKHSSQWNFRNFGYKWEDKRPKANRPCSQVYHGLAPFSENETRAIRVVLWGIVSFSDLGNFSRMLC